MGHEDYYSFIDVTSYKHYKLLFKIYIENDIMFKSTDFCLLSSYFKSGNKRQ